MLSISYGAFLAGIVRDQKDLEKALAQLREEIPKDYVSKRDDERRWDQLMKAVERIEAKLDLKADKP